MPLASRFPPPARWHRKWSRSAIPDRLSGGAALYGKNVLSGMEMAANEINAKGLEIGGKKYKLEIVALDDKYNPSETGINVQRLVQQHKTPAVLVPHSGGFSRCRPSMKSRTSCCWPIAAWRRSPSAATR